MLQNFRTSQDSNFTQFPINRDLRVGLNGFRELSRRLRTILCIFIAHGRLQPCVLLRIEDRRVLPDCINCALL